MLAVWLTALTAAGWFDPPLSPSTLPIYDATSCATLPSDAPALAVSEGLVATGVGSDLIISDLQSAHPEPHRVPLAGPLKNVALVRHCRMCGYAVAACGGAGLQVVNVSDARRPIAYAPVAGGAEVDDLRVSGGRSAFVIDRAGGRDQEGGAVVLYDIQNPRRVVYERSWIEQRGEVVADVAVALNILLIAVNSPLGPAGACLATPRLDILNISRNADSTTAKVSAPLRISATFLPCAGRIVAVAIHDTTAVVVVADHGVYTYDISAYDRPRLADFYEYPAGAAFLTPSSTLYLAHVSSAAFVALSIAKGSRIRLDAHSRNPLNVSVDGPITAIAAEDDGRAVYALYNRIPADASVLVTYTARSDGNIAPAVVVLVALGATLLVGLGTHMLRRCKGARAAPRTSGGRHAVV